MTRTRRNVAIVAVVVVVVALSLGVSAATLAQRDEPSNPAVQAVGNLPAVTSFSIRAQSSKGCVFDADRGGLLWKGLTVRSRETGALELTFYAQRDNLDHVLKGYVTTVLTFDKATRSRTFDLVIPVTRADYEAGYADCQFSTGGSRL